MLVTVYVYGSMSLKYLLVTVYVSVSCGLHNLVAVYLFISCRLKYLLVAVYVSVKLQSMYMLVTVYSISVNYSLCIC